MSRRRKRSKAARTLAAAQWNGARVGVLSGRLQQLLGGDGRVTDALDRLSPARRAKAGGR